MIPLGFIHLNMPPSLGMIKLISGSVLFAVALVGGIASLQLIHVVGNYERAISLGNVFAGSVFLTTGIAHMYNEAAFALVAHYRSDRARSDGEFGMIVASICCLGGFFCTLFLDMIWSLLAVASSSSDCSIRNCSSSVPSSNTPPIRVEYDPSCTSVVDSQPVEVLPCGTTHHEIAQTLPSSSSSSLRHDSAGSLDDNDKPLGHGGINRCSSRTKGWRRGGGGICCWWWLLGTTSGPKLPSQHTSTTSLAPSPFILLALLCVHSIMEGIALGVVQQKSSVLALLLGIVPHKGLAGLALMMNFLKHGVASSTALSLLLIFALATPTGVLFGCIIPTLASDGGFTGNCLMALSSGTFLYVAIVEILIPEFTISGAHSHGHNHSHSAGIPVSMSTSSGTTTSNSGVGGSGSSNSIVVEVSRSFPKPPTVGLMLGKFGVLLAGTIMMILFQLRE